MDSTSFECNFERFRVIFGAGRLVELPAEMERLRKHRALIICTPEQRDLAVTARELLGSRAAGIFDRARMHVPVELVRQAHDQAAALAADISVCAGGGSTIGLGKALALRHGIPLIAIPTTYAGSEMTSIWGMTENGLKTTGKDACVRPASVIYDPELTLSLPPRYSGMSGLNAMAHAIEALYAEGCNPLLSAIAEEAIRALCESLPQLYAAPEQIGARTGALYGAWLAGLTLGMSGVALHHKLCHALGGTLDLPHAETHSVMLPYSLAFNAPAIPAAMARLQRVLGPAPVESLLQLNSELGAPRSLAEIGMKRGDIPKVVDAAMKQKYNNPRRYTKTDLEDLLDRAVRGLPPHS
ncbi:MAG: maleylacetate reductase [Sphingomonadales bacterium]|nr:maleylacetate reductase [Sphingomonadales bacterium]